MFSFNILLVCSPEDLLFYEQRAIDRLQPEYNSSPTAGNTLGVRCDPERRRKISAAHKGKILTEEHRRNISLGNMGRTPSDETRVKLAAAVKVRSENLEWRRKLSEAKLGTRMSEENKEKLRKARTGVPANLSEEARLRKNKKIGEANRVRVITDQHRANMSEAQKNKAGVAKYLYKGEMLTMAQLSAMSSVDKVSVRHRIKVLGWSVEAAVDTPRRGS